MAGPSLGPDDARALARSVAELFRAAAEQLPAAEGRSDLVELIVSHVGCPMNEMPNVGARWATWEHANVHRGVEAYLAEQSPEATWFGIAGGGRSHEDVVDMLTMAERHRAFGLGAVDYATVAVGPDDTIDAVRFGLVATRAPDGAPVVLVLRAASMFGDDTCQLQVLAADRASATSARARIEQLMAEQDVFRGQVLAFGVSEHRGNALVTFLPRPGLTAQDVVLPDGVLDTIERHVVRLGKHAAVLRATGQHLKRGLLLHGAPGTGKTHTVRYLMSTLAEYTFVVISGPAIRMIGEATALARRLQPCVVVIEDVDLIAEDRSFGPGTNPFLFELLNQMDGVASDADVTFVLTTNRVQVLERALVDRPGRVDLAVDIPRPDAACRERLIRLYAGGLAGNLPGLRTVVDRTEGVTASFIRELVRRTVLEAAERDGSSVSIDEPRLLATLNEFSAETQRADQQHPRRTGRQPASPSVSGYADQPTATGSVVRPRRLMRPFHWTSPSRRRSGKRSTRRPMAT